jgi:hypothetical protein
VIDFSLYFYFRILFSGKRLRGRNVPRQGELLGDVIRFMIQKAHVGFLHVPIKIEHQKQLVRSPNRTAKTLVEETTLLIH